LSVRLSRRIFRIVHVECGAVQCLWFRFLCLFLVNDTNLLVGSLLGLLLFCSALIVRPFDSLF
jgi:hypothetical protein